MQLFSCMFEDRPALAPCPAVRASTVLDLATGGGLADDPAGDHETSARPGKCGPVRGEAAGRECLFEIESKPLEEVRDYLERVSQQWDEALARLKTFVEM